MGAWGVGPFDNDDAADWVYDLEGAEDLRLVRAALDFAATDDGYLDVNVGGVAVAAATVLAVCAGRIHADLPAPVTAWIAERDPSATPADIRLAAAAIDRVLGRRSELMDLWKESNDTTSLDRTWALRRSLSDGPGRGQPRADPTPSSA